MRSDCRNLKGLFTSADTVIIIGDGVVVVVNVCFFIVRSFVFLFDVLEQLLCSKIILKENLLHVKCISYLDIMQKIE